jgi:hypothetical protein
MPNPLGRWNVCGGGCCGLDCTAICQPGTTPPWLKVTLGGVANAGCIYCNCLMEPSWLRQHDATWPIALPPGTPPEPCKYTATWPFLCDGFGLGWKLEAEYLVSGGRNKLRVHVDGGNNGEVAFLADLGTGLIDCKDLLTASFVRTLGTSNQCDFRAATVSVEPASGDGITWISPGCENCGRMTRRGPVAWLATFSGWQNLFCNKCADINGQHVILDPSYASNASGGTQHWSYSWPVSAPPFALDGVMLSITSGESIGPYPHSQVRTAGLRLYSAWCLLDGWLEPVGGTCGGELAFAFAQPNQCQPGATVTLSPIFS